MRERANIDHKCYSSSYRSDCVKLIVLSLLLSSCSVMFAQVSATFKGDSAKIEIGDHLNMRFVVNAPKDFVVDFPRFDGDSIGKIDIIKKDKIDTAQLGANTIYSQNLTVSAYDEGQYFFSPIKVYFLNKATGAVDTAYTNDWLLTVTSMQVDTSKPIKPIKAPLKVPYKLNEFTWWIIAALALIIAAIIGFVLYRKYKKKPEAVVARPKPKDPAHIWANKELRKLEQEKLWQKDEVKQYHSRLTDILRSYLEYRYDYYAMEATTEEIQQEIAKLDINLDATGKLMETLRLADYVKFAKMNPAPDQNTKSLQNAFAFVEQTKQKVETTEPVKK